MHIASRASSNGDRILIIIKEAIAKIDGKEIEISGELWFDKSTRLGAEITLHNYMYWNEEIEYISGMTDKNIRFSIWHPFIIEFNTTLSPQVSALQSRLKIVMTSASFIEEPSLEPNFVRCHLKNIRTNFSGEFKYKDADFEIISINNANKYPEKGKIGAILNINVGSIKAHELEKIIDSICMLLSFSQRVPVIMTYIERYFDNKFLSAETYRIVEDYTPAIPMFSYFAQEHSDFVNDTLSTFLKVEAEYNMRILSHYYCMAYTEIYDVSKFLNGSIFMESLKYNWAKNISRLYKVMHPNGIIKGFKEKYNSNRELTFRQLMIKVANNLGINNHSFTFIENRNFIFHTGLPMHSHLPHNHTDKKLWKELLDLYDHMDDFLFKLLDYSGNIHTIRNPNSHVYFPR